MKEIGHCDTFKKACYHTRVMRDAHGKFYVEVNGIITQKRLTAEEVVRYLLNAMHMEIEDDYPRSAS